MINVAPDHKGEVFSADHVLVVEDEVLIRMYVAEELREVGFSVIETSSAEEALLVLKNTDDVGVLLTDIDMPGAIDGISLARSVRAAFPAIKIVIVSANLGPIVPPEADAVYPKPVDMAKLVARLRQLLSRKERYGPGTR